MMNLSGAATDVEQYVGNPLNSFILIKKLTVEPPGDTVFMNSAVFLDLRSSEFATSPLERNISVNIPKVAVKGSERIFIATAPGKINYGWCLRCPIEIFC